MLIDIEGIDGSGKGTQARLLCERFTKAGVSAALVSFPRYEATLFGRAVGEYLNGAYGSLADVHPFLVSLLFAGDRLESKQFLLDTIAAHEVVVLDRYVASNVAHQASKLAGPARGADMLQSARGDLAGRILEIEFGIFGLPRPDIVLLLDLPVSVAQELIARKGARQYTDRKADIQEADARYLAEVQAVYRELAASEANWRTIACCDDQRLRSVEEIAGDVWNVVSEARDEG